MSMEISRQSQSAGDNSQQFQLGNVTNLTIVNGISEQRAREIFQEMNQQTIAKYTQDAREEAFRRIGILENQVMKRAQEVNGVLEAFSDPAFQILLAEAQKRAAATERQNDYDLLGELLVAHVQKGAQRTQRAGINRAIEIVGDIDTQALCALTVAHALTNYAPITGEINRGLDVLDDMFTRLIDDVLPSGDSWLDHLDVLGAMRLSSIGNMKKFKEYYPTHLDGYSVAGIKKDSDDYQKAVDILSKVNISSSILIDNECLDGYVRLCLSGKHSISSLVFKRGAVSVNLTPEQTESIHQVWNMYSKDTVAINTAKNNFMQLLSTFDTLNTVQNWWDNIPGAFHITQVGRVLAHTNAKRCDPKIPDLI